VSLMVCLAAPYPAVAVARYMVGRLGAGTGGQVQSRRQLARVGRGARKRH
jgi:hypothetical protein